MKTKLKTILIITLALTIFGCSKDADNPPKEDLIPTITGIDPDSGPKNTVVTISGDNFGTDASKVKVYFDEVEAIVQSVTNTQITTLVPPRAYSGFVKIIINGKELTEQEFLYLSSELIVSTFAGNTEGFADGTGTDAKFYGPRGIAFDSQGNLYVADTDNQKIRKITPNGTVSTLAGSSLGYEDGPGVTARFTAPTGVAVDGQGNVYVADFNNHLIRKITPDGVVSTLAGSTSGGYADGTGTAAQFAGPSGVVVDEHGNVFVADTYNHRIRKITPNGEVSTLAGSTQGFADGTGTAAQFDFPLGITINVRGDLLVADTQNHKIRKVLQNGEVITIAGSTEGFANGTGSDVQFSSPIGLATDTQNNLYIVDAGNHKIRKMSPQGEVSTLAGSTQGFADGVSGSAQFSNPFGIAIDSEGIPYISDSSNNRIRVMIWE